MKKVAVVLIVFLLVVTAVWGGVWSWNQYVLLDWKLYPKDSKELDLRGQALTQEQFDSLQARLPDCHILWSVPFQGGAVSSDTKELTVSSLEEEDVIMLDYLTELTCVHGEDCSDYAQLLALLQRRPECRVTYVVPVDGKNYDQDTTSVVVENLTEEDLANMEWLPQLSSVKASRCQDYDQLRRLCLNHPQWTVSYSVWLGGKRIASTAKIAYVEGADGEELLQGVPALLKLETLNLVNCSIRVEELETLRQSCPNVDVTWSVRLGGQQFTEGTREIRLEKAELGSLEEVRAAAVCLPNLEKLVLEDCTVGGESIDNEELAALREECRQDFKLVWKVYCGKVPAMTDDTWFMPIQKGEYYFQHDHAYNLRYCEDMICIDVGHSVIRNVDFAAYMPHLKYLVITDTQVQDISGISNCKELVFFEDTFTIIRDLSPLLGCTALEDLNLDTPRYSADMTPVYQMSWLKNLFISDTSERIILKAQEEMPDTRVDWYGRDARSGMGWRNLQNYYDMRDILGMGYMI